MKKAPGTLRKVSEKQGLENINVLIIDLFVSEVKGVLRKYDTPQDEFAAKMACEEH